MRVYGVAFLRETLDRTRGEISRSSTFKILGEDSFEGGSWLAGVDLHCYADSNCVVLFDLSLNQHEEARSVTCLSLPEGEGSQEERHYFAVGTAFIDPDQEESTRGRIILVCSTGQGQFNLLAETPTRGAVHSIGQLPKGLFAASSNSEVSCSTQSRSATDNKAECSPR